MNKDFWRVMRSFFKIGMIGFGGGSALIPVIEDEIVQKQNLISEDRYTEHTITSNITPGTMPVKLAMLSAYDVSGISGMLGGSMAVTIPGTFITILLLVLLSQLGDSAILQIRYASVGISVFIIYLLLGYICKVMQKAKKTEFLNVSVAIAVLTTLITCGKEIRALLKYFLPDHPFVGMTPVFDLNTISVLVLVFFFIFFTCGEFKSFRMAVAGVVGVFYVLLFGKANLLGVKGTSWMQITLLVFSFAWTVWDVRSNGSILGQRPDRRILFKKLIAYIVLFVVACLLALFSIDDAARYIIDGSISVITDFGGGEAYLTVADGLFVSTGVVDSALFYGQIIPIANSLPGPILVKVLSGIGYCIGFAQKGVFCGCLLALVGFLVATSCTCVICLLVDYVYHTFSSLAVFGILEHWILPTVCGLLISTIFSITVSVLDVSIAGGLSTGASVLFLGVLGALTWLLSKCIKISDVTVILILGGLSVLVINLF